MKYHPNKCRAVSLVETLTYVAVLGVVVFVSSKTVGNGSRQASVMRFQSEDMSAALNAGERWRSDIRVATTAPKLGEESGTIQLETSEGLVNYSFDGKRLLRRVGNAKPRELIRGQVETSRMILDQRKGVTAWRWELELKRRNPRSQMRPLFTFLAVPAAP